VIYFGLWVIGTVVAIATVFFLLSVTVYGLALSTVKARTAAERLTGNAWAVVLLLLVVCGAGALYTSFHPTAKHEASARASLPFCPENRTPAGTLARTLENLDIAEAAQEGECRPRD
jgi:hypothetical protein